MHIKLRYSNVLFFLIIIIIICECNGFRLLGIDDDIYKFFILVAVGTGFCICLFQKGISTICMTNGKFIYYYICMIGVFLLFEYGCIVWKYGKLQSFYGFMIENKHHMQILAAIPLLYIFIKRRGVEEVMDHVAVLVTITLGLLLVHAFLKITFSIELLHVSRYAREIHRNGRMRVWDISSLEGLAVIYTGYRVLFGGKKKMIYLTQAAICVATLVYVEQTRMMLIAIACGILYMIVKVPCKTRGGVICKAILMILLGAIGYLIVFPALASSFSINSVMEILHLCVSWNLG